MTPVRLASYLGGTYPFTLTTGANAPAGGSIVLIFGGSGPPGPADVITDSAGNTYASSAVDGTGWYSVAICANNLHLPMGGTITIPQPGGSDHAWCVAFYVDAILSSDVFGAGAFGGAVFSYTTSPLSVEPEFVVGVAHVYPGGGGFVTPAVGWTNALNGGVTGTGSLLANIDYKVVTSTVAITYAPPMANFHGTNYINVFTFKPAITPPPPTTTGGRVKWF